MIADGEENSARRSETAKFGAILLGKSAAGEEKKSVEMRRRRSKLLAFGDVKPLKTSSAGPKTYLAAPQNNLPKVVNTTFPSPHHFSKELKSGIYHLFTGEWKALVVVVSTAGCPCNHMVRNLVQRPQPQGTL